MAKKLSFLAIDTVYENCSVAVCQIDSSKVPFLLSQNFHTLTEHIKPIVITKPSHKRHADIVLSLVEEVLADAKIHKSKLNAIFYAKGPGSFTGVRITASVVQGLAFGLKIPVVGISNLRTIASKIFRVKLINECRVVVDARMTQFYYNHFVLCNQEVTAKLPDKLIALEELKVMIEKTSAVSEQMPSNIFFVPDAVNQCDSFLDLAIEQKRILQTWHNTAEELLILGLTRFSEKNFDGLALPFYLRNQV